MFRFLWFAALVLLALAGSSLHSTATIKPASQGTASKAGDRTAQTSLSGSIWTLRLCIKDTKYTLVYTLP